MNPFHPDKHPRLDDDQRPFSELMDYYAPRSVAHWSEARRYLTTERGLDPRLVDHLHRTGTVYANDLGGVVFLHHSRHGNVLGASIRSIQNGHRFSIGSDTIAWFAVGDWKTATRIVVTKGPIDAISFYQLHPQPGLVTVSLAGHEVPHGLLVRLAGRRRARPYLALDRSADGSDGTTDALITWMLFQTGRSLRVLKPMGIDWNDDVLTGRPCPAKRPTGRRLRRLLALWTAVHSHSPLRSRNDPEPPQGAFDPPSQTA